MAQSHWIMSSVQALFEIEWFVGFALPVQGECLFVEVFMNGLRGVKFKLAFLAGAGCLALGVHLAEAATPEIMMAQCRSRAHDEFKIRLPDIDTKYEGQRTDGTHAVNGTAFLKTGERTFQCSFNRDGDKIVQFVVNEPAAAKSSGPVPGPEFDATGNIPCARVSGQPMTNCKFGVKREDRKNGNGMITVFWPDGGNRVISYEDNTPVSFDQSEADGDAKMTVGQDSDLYKVTIGAQRFEIPEAVMTGG